MYQNLSIFFFRIRAAAALDDAKFAVYKTQRRRM